MKWNVRRLSCGAVGRNAPPGNASGALANTWWYPASVVQSATVASQASTTNERSALNRFCDPGSASPATVGRSSALTLTVLTSCGLPPASATVTVRPPTPSRDAQSVDSVSSPSLSRFTPSPVIVAPDAVDARLCARFSRSSWARPGRNSVLNRWLPKPAPVATNEKTVPGTIWKVSGIGVSGSVSTTGTDRAS